MVIKADANKFDNYLQEVRAHFPDGFEESIQSEGLGTCVTAYVAVSFMRDGSPEIAAKLIVDKLGADE